MADTQTMTAAALREAFGLSRGYASDLVNGKRQPSLALALRIQERFGVPVSHWQPASEAA